MKDYCTQNEGDCSTCSLSSYGKDCQGNKVIDVKPYMEHLQETGKVIITDENVQELQEELKVRGYITQFESTDRDYLKLISLIV